VAFVDLLGQQAAFLKMDYVPTDESQREAFVAEVQASIGTIRTMRALLEQFREGLGRTNVEPGDPLFDLPAEARDRITAMKARVVREHRWSDGFMLACPLKPRPGHSIPIMAVYDILCSCATLMLVQLAMGRPVRGGVDVGAGMELDGELFGACIVKAYQLESKVARSPRLVVGDELVRYLRASTVAPGDADERKLERGMSTALLPLIVPDPIDGKMVIDFAGAQLRDFLQGSSPTPDTVKLFADGLAFAESALHKYAACRDDKELELLWKYTRLTEYLRSRAWLWTGNPG